MNFKDILFQETKQNLKDIILFIQHTFIKHLVSSRHYLLSAKDTRIKVLPCV